MGTRTSRTHGIGTHETRALKGREESSYAFSVRQCTVTQGLRYA
jgi:hypothetical protein